MNTTIGTELAGERIDKVVSLLTGLSRRVARTLVEEGDVLVDGTAVAPKDRVEGGEQVRIRVPVEQTLEPEEVPFGVRFEDGVVAVIDKPAGVVVHPGAGVSKGTLAAGLLYRWPQVEGVGVEDRWGIVHRLDRDTSGLLLVALTEDAYQSLTGAMAERSIKRTYLALVEGLFPLPAGTVDAPIGRDPRNPRRRALRRDGRPARTQYRRLASWEEPDLSLLEVRLETGRTHQIRVHMASIDHPVVGDTVYGGRPSGRMWLHAVTLSFMHPVRGEEITVASPLPDDLREELDELGEPDIGTVPVDR
ncbi:MAG: RluA family pseudouridine synthase [Acidimicrobiia bacterium]